ncbi:glycerophosphodiester phosphodiesterase family protein [Pseudoroseicyclus tamaricis]|uniref:glycerophosphodiester phosphodiesterase n=1 Tax=Pseudoroseicyclus tamaricis TaxID=2705421 RepID=A0A6B2JQU2_9RHOB|nr:glycerophosphodiester phosphodiesterase family protein [Pseudoroseicyclus tamaricis]NDV00410.1 glycerophosphodiester phosphodiesterase [Pseudoroseicyclus tamaricis]
MSLIRTTALAALAAGAALPALAQDAVSYGPRPAYLISQMEEGELKDTLAACAAQTPAQTPFSIGHRGAPLMFPEHTVESNRAAATMGAGILECDVTFTSDLELVCRHAQNDLHTTTNIVTTDLAENCTTPFTAAEGETPASAECRTSDITLAEFQTLMPKMDASDASATTPEDYVGGTANWRTDLYAGNATLMTHAESIALFDELGADFTPELKSPSVEMPFNGFSQEDYAQKLVDEYVAAGIDPSRVWPQSFSLDDVLYWIENTPEFGEQAVYLIDDSSIEGLDGMDPATWGWTPAKLKEQGVNYVAPAIPFLVTLDETGEIVPSELSIQLADADIGIVAWTLERSGPLASGGGWYYHTITDAIDNDGDYFEVLDVLAQDVGVVGVFSDWPATVTYYANCMGL